MPRFQSQTRSRSTCDRASDNQYRYWLNVSISDEKPLHMRRHMAVPVAFPAQGFNLRREAAPHATLCPPVEYLSYNSVSISDEKPLHMRPLIILIFSRTKRT